MKLFALTSAFFLSLQFNLWASEQSRIRCSFDIGSGETKVAAANLNKGSVKILYRNIVRVPIKKSVQDGILPYETSQKLSSTIAQLKASCLQIGATEFVGVATSGFRAATVNGKEVLDAISEENGVNLRIISGEEEARLGYKAVQGNLTTLEKNKALVVWDMGGGSMQFSAKTGKGSALMVHSLPIGSTSFVEVIASNVKPRYNSSVGILPLSHQEALASGELAIEYAAQLPEKLREAISRKNVLVVGIGGAHVEALAQSIGDNPTYTLSGAIKLKSRLLNLDIKGVKAICPKNNYPESLPSNAVLVSNIMQFLKIKEVKTMEVNLTDGLF